VYGFRAFSSDNRSDLFRRGALGKLAGRVWDLVLTDTLSAKEISVRLDCHVVSAKRALAKLETAKLAKRVDGKKWVGLSAVDERLVDLAAVAGTWGKTKNRREKHTEERQEWITNRILLLKRKRERVRAQGGR